MYYKECPELTFGLWNSAINSLGDVTKYGNWRGGSLGREAGKSRLKTELRSVGRNPFTFFCIWPNQQKDSPTGKNLFFFFPSERKAFLEHEFPMCSGETRGAFRGNSRQWIIGGAPGQALAAGWSWDPESRSGGETIPHQPQSCGEVHQVHWLWSQPGFWPREPWVRAVVLSVLLLFRVFKFFPD